MHEHDHCIAEQENIQNLELQQASARQRKAWAVRPVSGKQARQTVKHLRHAVLPFGKTAAWMGVSSMSCSGATLLEAPAGGLEQQVHRQ